ncbi:MAG: 2-amino-4-hydroxy-6-hydroxymethyldihydropteridine diphosphokinase [Saprospiraceae bacterium]
MGFQTEDDFYNQALEVKTDRSPSEVLKISKEIEEEVGRVSNEKWHPRVLILTFCYLQKVIQQEGCEHSRCKYV